MAYPQRQIRALFDSDSIVVYQAYSEDIGIAAVREQKLNACPDLKVGRMTWIKPSWCWMMYRCGYSYKDKGQERVLALRMSHRHFEELLEAARLSTDIDATTRPDQTRVQWDPERSLRLERLTHRSIQIGIPVARCKQWVEHGIQSIEDVTEKARELKRVLDSDPEKSSEDLLSLGLMPPEREYPLPKGLAGHLGMIE